MKTSQRSFRQAREPRPGKRGGGTARAAPTPTAPLDAVGGHGLDDASGGAVDVPQLHGLLRHLQGTAGNASVQSLVASHAATSVQRGDPTATDAADDVTVLAALDRLRTYREAAVQMILDLTLTLEKFEALVKIDEPWVTGWAAIDAGLELAEAGAIAASDEWEGRIALAVKLLKIGSTNAQRLASQSAAGTSARGTATRADTLQLLLRSSTEGIDAVMARARTHKELAEYWATAPALGDVGPGALASMVSDKLAFQLVAKLFSDHGATLTERRTNRWFTQILKDGVDTYEASEHYAVVRGRHDDPYGNLYIVGDPEVGYVVEDYDPPGIDLWYEPDAAIYWRVTRVEGVSDTAVTELLGLMDRAGIRKQALMDPTEAFGGLEFEDNTDWLPIWVDAPDSAPGAAEVPYPSPQEPEAD
jgi:hypothetical protein